MKNFEMANSDDPEGMIMATQRSIIAAMRQVIEGLKEDLSKDGKKCPPGLTWEQIDYLLEGFKNKKPEIIYQPEEM